MRLGRISWNWPRKKGLVLSSDNDELEWLLDSTPEGIEEAWHFDNPNALLSLEDTRNALENHDYSQDIQGKKHFRSFATKVGGWWSVTLIALIIAQGAPFIPYQLEIEEFIAVVTTTTASIFGIVYVIGRYLYGSKAYASKTTANDSVAPK